MNFNNKFKTGSVCGGISKSGVNIRTSRGIPANVIGQPGHAAILYYSQDANGNGNWKIDNDVGGWLAATKGERHLLGWGNAAWQRNSGGTVVYFHLAQTCLNDYDNLVRAEEYTWLAKVYQGDLDTQEKLYEKALHEVGEANAAIFEIHQMMLEDGDYQDSIENIIHTQMVNAEYAVAQTADNFSQMFASMDDDYMRGRAADVKDISERLLMILQGEEEKGVDAGEPMIIVADDLAPSETVQLDKDMVLSFVTVHGSLNSHTAILARTMSIPALVGTALPLDTTVDGKVGIVDGTNGVIYVDPDEETLNRMQKVQKEEKEKKELLLTIKGKENITLDGQKIMLYANIGNIKDLATVLQNDAGGIGLFRSEFIYLEKDRYPTEEEQFQIYRTVAETIDSYS